ncbi:MAG: site-specific DNA-methyltransferase, partial [Pirellulales bacterium]
MAKRGPKSAPKKPAKKPIEQYEHSDKKRVNNPPVGLVTPETDPDAGRKTYQYDPHLDPQLVWAGKAEHTSFEVPTVSLHVHERIDPKTIIQAVRKNGSGQVSVVGGQLRQQGLFEHAEQNPPIRDAVEFYQHQHNWTNRLIAGDSLLVMNSLLEKEGLAGKVQMVYLDPPYGIRYGSNFQPFTNRRDVKDGRDEDLTQEPETIRAFRDTWELGIHSYLTYLRDRLLLARELLHESGSIFVQIGDENVHRVRAIMDEVFRPENFCSVITAAKTSGPNSPTARTDVLGSISDYVIWYARNKEHVKYRRLFKSKSLGDEGTEKYRHVESPDGKAIRLMTRNECRGITPLPALWRPFLYEDLTSQTGAESITYEVSFAGNTYRPSSRRGWRTHQEGMSRLMVAQRIISHERTLMFKRYLGDYAANEIRNLWADTTSGASSADPKIYVVQTRRLPVERCLLMTSDPGDLIFDPTCGSGTTAYVAEQWGRRWITCDTSRVAVTLAKQRLMTAAFDYYQLAHSDEGVGSGFKYKTVPHVTLKSIANNPEIKPGVTWAEIDTAIAKYADQETLYDQPLVDKSKARVTGPFTVEAVPAATVRPLDEAGRVGSAHQEHAVSAADGNAVGEA